MKKEIKTILEYNKKLMKIPPKIYEYKSLELDPNITKLDLFKLEKKLISMTEIMSPWYSTDAEEWLYGWSGYREKTPDVFRAYTIVDKGKRVGVVAVDEDLLIWASWVSGKQYALRGAMKLIEMINESKDSEFDQVKKEGFSTYIHKRNIPSLKTAEKLKMPMVECDEHDNTKLVLKPPFWFLKEGN